MIVSTARYIGLRTYRYGPTTTRWAVGIGGAGVPSARANRMNASSSTMTPLRMAMAATIATGETQSPVHGIRHPVISPGISPATTPGVSTRTRPCRPMLGRAHDPCAERSHRAQHAVWGRDEVEATNRPL